MRRRPSAPLSLSLQPLGATCALRTGARMLHVQLELQGEGCRACGVGCSHSLFFFFMGFLRPGMRSALFPGLRLPRAARVAGSRGQPLSGLGLHHLLFLYPSPSSPGFSYGSLFLPLRIVSGSRSTLLGPQAEVQGREITVREALWVKLNPNSLFGAGGFGCISERVPVTWALLKAATGEKTQPQHGENIPQLYCILPGQKQDPAKEQSLRRTSYAGFVHPKLSKTRAALGLAGAMP